jgi:hypothetical protein
MHVDGIKNLGWNHLKVEFHVKCLRIISSYVREERRLFGVQTCDDTRPYLLVSWNDVCKYIALFEWSHRVVYRFKYSFIIIIIIIIMILYL